MKKERFDQLMASLAEMREQIAVGSFAGRIREIEVCAADIRAVREPKSVRKD